MTGGGQRRREAPAYERPSLRIQPRLTSKLRVLVAHQLRLVAPALRLSLAERAQVLPPTVFGAAAVAVAELVAPGVVVVGDVLADGAVEQFLPPLLRTGARVVLLGADADGDRGLAILRLGASGLVSLDSTPAEVAGAVLRVAGGEAVMPARIGDAVLREWRSQVPATPPAGASPLTDREHDVLSAMGDGLGTKAIARRLGIALKTVEHHKTRVFQKLGVRSHAEVLTLMHAAPPAGVPEGSLV